MFCQKCGKYIKNNEVISKNGQTLCSKCANTPYAILNENNIIPKNFENKNKILKSKNFFVIWTDKIGRKKFIFICSVCFSVITAVFVLLISELRFQAFCNHKWNETNCQSPKICNVCGAAKGEKGDHTTHKGKCQVCDKFILDEAFLPDKDDYTDVLMFDHMANTFSHNVISTKQSGTSGFKAYVEVPDSVKIEGIVHNEHDYVLFYHGNRVSNCLTQFYMYLEPENISDLDDLYNAVNSHYTELYGLPHETHEVNGKEFGKTWHDKEEILSINTTIDDNCMIITLELLDDLPWN